MYQSAVYVSFMIFTVYVLVSPVTLGIFLTYYGSKKAKRAYLTSFLFSFILSISLYGFRLSAAQTDPQIIYVQIVEEPVGDSEPSNCSSTECTLPQGIEPTGRR